MQIIEIKSESEAQDDLLRKFIIFNYPGEREQIEYLQSVLFSGRLFSPLLKEIDFHITFSAFK